MNNVLQEVNRLYKSHFGKMVTALLQFTPGLSLETIEDIVQDSFTAALTNWQEDGIPGNAAGWIYTVCKNKALNKIKETKRLQSLSENESGNIPPPLFSSSPFDDEQLRLLFCCAHPDLSPKAQVVITLKYVVNLKIEAIAKVLGMTIDGIDKLLSRVKQKIKEEKLFFYEPGLPALSSRINIVHKIIYLLFTEGYKSSWGKEMIREELCEEALLMTKALIESPVSNKETAALYALMLFNASRLKARFDHSGELLELEEQDRSLWNTGLILLGCDYLQQSAGAPANTYQYEASIAYLHCTGKSFRQTDWLSISKLYSQLLQLNPNPFVELNYAIALYYAGQKQHAFQLLNDLRQNAYLRHYYLLNATLGKLYLLEGSFAVAKAFFLATLQQTSYAAEKQFIQRMISKIPVD